MFRRPPVKGPLGKRAREAIEDRTGEQVFFVFLHSPLPRTYDPITHPGCDGSLSFFLARVLSFEQQQQRGKKIKKREKKKYQEDKRLVTKKNKKSRNNNAPEQLITV